jgi:Mrp family chromosome partitioning ATPase
LAQVRREYDFVIIDSSPVLAADDTTNVAPKMDGVIFVIRESFTYANAAQRAIAALQRRGLAGLGIVFNRTHRTRDAAYHDYPQYYGVARSRVLEKV